MARVIIGGDAARMPLSSSASNPRRPRLLACLAAVLLTALGAGLTTWPLPFHLAGATLRSGEVLLTAWQLNWFQHALTTSPLSWADANIFFPYAGTAAYNDLLLTHALVTLPLAWTESPVIALNVALLGGIVLCAVCAWLLIDELVAEPWSAAIAGVLFALAPYRFLQLGHLSMAAAWPIPLFCWALLRHLRQPSSLRALAVAVTGLLVGLSSLYNAAYVAPLLPLLLLVGARRGPGGRAVWLPLIAVALPAMAVMVWFLLPFASALRRYGPASAPNDLLTYGADLASVAQRPDYLAGSSPSLNAEAHLYPGAGLAWLAAAGAIVGLLGVWSLRGWRRPAAVALLALAVIAGVLASTPLPLTSAAARLLVLGLVWIGPVLLMAWAVGTATPRTSMAPAAAARVGLAAASLALVLALGPVARLHGEPFGQAPYVLLTTLSSAFQGTRVPARFGSVALLFIAVLAAAPLAVLLGAARRAWRGAGIALGAGALLVCFFQLPLPPLPEGHSLVGLPRLQDPVYRWLSEQPGNVGVLELPDWPTDADVDYRLREFRSLRHMLASKQHHKRLVNGTGRIEPFLWQRFRWLEPWSDEFFTYIAAYFPVRYVLVHEAGIPAGSRQAVLSRLASGADGWRELHRSTAIRVYEIDRSAARGAVVDRLVLRRELPDGADVRFAARLLQQSGAENAENTPMPDALLQLSRDGEPVAECPLAAAWQPCRATVPLLPAGEARSEWPRTTALLRWQVPNHPQAAFEIRDLAIAPQVAGPE